MKLPFTTQPLAGMLAKADRFAQSVSAEEMEEIYIDALAAKSHAYNLEMT